MKKGTFKIKWQNDKTKWEWKEVKGFLSDNFGIHKDDAGNFRVTHLKTGLLVAYFDFLRQARKFVHKLETEEFPVAWDSSIVGEDYRPNADKALKIKHSIQHT